MPSSSAGWSSPTTPASVRAVLPGMEQLVLGRLERRLGLRSARVERLDDALRAREAALDDPGDAHLLVGQLAAAGR